jgi:PAS domain S-box-containing protein
VDPDQAPRLDQLVNQAKSCLEATANLVAARRQSAETPSLALITRGKQAMDAVRSTVQQMEDQEKRLLAQRVQRVRATRRYTSAAIGLGSILTIVFLSVAGLIVSREIRVAAKAQAQVRALNADLEERVEQRTAALRESETKLTVSEQLLRSLLDGVVDYAIYMLDAEGRVVSWNSGAARINGYQAEEIIGKHVSCFYTAIDLERNRPAAALHEAATTGKFEEQGVRVRKDGSNFWADVVITPLHDANGDLTGYSKVVRDITARKQAEEVRELLAAIVDFSDDAIISKTLDGTIAAWNRGAENVFGYSAAEIVGKPIQLLLPPDRAHEESDILARITRGESVDHFETVRVRKDGTNIDVSVTISPIRDSDGVIVGASKIARDITGRKQAEDALREKERRLSESQRIAHVGSWSYDLTVPEARIAWSDELYRLYGVPPDTEGFGRPGASLVWHQHRHQRAQKDRGATGAASGAIAPFPRVAGNSDVHASECDE